MNQQGPRSARLPRGSRRLPLASLLSGIVLLIWAFGGSFLPPEGPVLLRVEAPVPGAVVGPEGIQVVVHFASRGLVAEETFRATLNGAEVTHVFTTGANGAQGRLHALLDGENVLRVAVFGRGWPGRQRFFEQFREVRFRLRRPLNLDRG